MKKNMNKKIIITLVAIFLIAIITFGVSYSFYSGKVEIFNQTGTVIQSAKYQLIYTGESEINANNMIPGDSYTKTFSVENTNKSALIYNIYIENVYSEFNDDLVYSILDENNNVVVAETPLPKTTETKAYLMKNKTIESGEKINYILKVEYKYYADIDQSENNGAKFSGTMGVDMENLVHKVVFNASGGSTSFAESSVIEGEEYSTLPVASKDGYTFLGWYTSENDGTKIEENNLFDLKEDQTLYAHWSANTYTITFNTNGGTSETVSKDITYDSTYGELPTPTLTGYTFKGWYLDSSYNKLVTNETVVKITANSVLYAKWGANSYTITLNADGGEVASNTIEVEFANTYSDLPTPTKTGYTFIGWHDEEGNLINNTTIVDKATNQTLTAYWSTNSYTVTFDATGGSVDSTTKTVTYDAEYGELPMPTKTGYTFVGWYTKASNGEKIESTTIVKTASQQTLYAHWSANSYTVTFDANGGSVDPTSKSVTYASPYGELPIPTYEGYDFVGWYTATSGGIQVTDKTGVSIVENQTLYAIWSARTDTIYKVVHWQQNIGGDKNKHDADNYTIIDTQLLSGTTNEKVAPSVNEYEGFTAPSVEQLTIKNDGSAVLNYYYIRNAYNVTVNKTTGVDTTTGGGTYQYGADVTIGYTLLPGYSFVDIIGDQVSQNFKMPASNVTLQINAKANNYDITFNPNGGSVDITKKTVTYNKTYGDLPTPSKTGYTFAGWYTAASGGIKITSDTTVSTTSNQTLYAQWTANTYIVSFDSNGGNTISTILTATYDKTYGELPTPTRTGYTFAGWYTAKTDGTKVTSTTKYNLTSNQTLYAYWTANTYTVTFNANGGSTDATSKTVTYNSTYGELPTASKTGYTFVGWYTAASGGTEVLDTTKVSITSTQTLYAHYSQNTYTVKFDANSGTTSVDSKNVVYDSIYGELPTPTKTGYTFKGWFTDKTNGTKITSDTTVKITATQTLYAHWQVNTYIVSFNSNGGDAVSTTVTVTYGSTYGTLPTPSRTGYTFNGWYTATSGGTKITSSSTVSITTAQTLYAQWTANTYTVTFNANGGTITTTSKTVTYDSTYGELPTPTKTGYTFAGWYTAETNGTRITSGTKVSITAAQTLYAQWTANSYKLTINANGGTIPTTTGWTLSSDSKTATKSVTYAGTYGSLPTPTRTGYTFAGWYTTETAGTKVTSTTKYSTASNQTLYAQWTANNYTVTLNANGGTTSTTTLTVTYGSTYETLPTPSRTGYTFNGWYTATSGGTKITSSSTVSITAAQTLYAQWTANTYTVTFNANGGTVTTTSKTVTYDSTYGELPTPTKTGYTFNYWYTAASGGTQVLSTTKVSITAAQTLYAHWTANTNTAYKVVHWQQNIGGTASSHDSNNYTVSNTENLTGTTGASITPAVKSYTGFTSPSTQTTTIAANGSTTVNYYYTRNSYKLTVNKSTGVASVTGAGTYQYGANVTIGYTISTGYTYTGITGDKTSATFTMPASNTTVQVNAKANTYTVTANANGGTIPTTSGWTVASGSATATKSVTYASTYGTLPTPSKTGYTFKGWYTAASGGTKITSSSTVSITAAQTLYAQWTANTYTVTLDANGGSTSTTTLTVTYAGTYGSLPTPTRTGYTFLGWYTATYKDHPLYYYADTYGDLKNAFGYNEASLYNHWINNGKNEGRRISQYLATDTVTTAGNITMYAGWNIKSYAVTISTSNASSSATSVSVTYGSTNTVTITPSSGYYLSSVSCTNGYTTNAATGVDKYDAQTITISNNSKDSTSTCTFTASRINASSLTYSNSATTKTNVQDALDELYTKLK